MRRSHKIEHLHLVLSFYMDGWDGMDGHRWGGDACVWDFPQHLLSFVWHRWLIDRRCTFEQMQVFHAVFVLSAHWSFGWANCQMITLISRFVIVLHSPLVLHTTSLSDGNSPVSLWDLAAGYQYDILWVVMHHKSLLLLLVLVLEFRRAHSRRRGQRLELPLILLARIRFNHSTLQRLLLSRLTHFLDQTVNVVWHTMRWVVLLVHVYIGRLNFGRWVWHYWCIPDHEVKVTTRLLLFKAFLVSGLATIEACICTKKWSLLA